MQPRTTRRILTSLLDTGVPDASLYEPEPMDFGVRWGYPTLAKLNVGGALLAAIALILLVWAVIRPVRRKYERGRDPG